MKNWQVASTPSGRTRSVSPTRARQCKATRRRTKSGRRVPVHTGSCVARATAPRQRHGSSQRGCYQRKGARAGYRAQPAKDPTRCHHGERQLPQTNTRRIPPPGWPRAPPRHPAILSPDQSPPLVRPGEQSCRGHRARGSREGRREGQREFLESPHPAR